MKRYNANQFRLICNLLVIGVIAMGIYIIWLFPTAHSDLAGLEPITRSPGDQQQPQVQNQDTLTSDEMRAYLASRRETGAAPDPFLSSGEVEWKAFLGEIKARPPRLEGIIDVQGVRAALIQGALFRQGDEVSGFSIVEINDSEVILSKDGRRSTIHLSK